QQAARTARSDYYTVLRVAGGGNTVEAAAGPAVQAVGRVAVSVKMDQKAVGARRCPGFLNAERFHAPDLHRLKTIAAASQGRRNPVVGRHGLDHLFAEIVFLEHKLDQMRPACEHPKKEAAMSIKMQPGGIARQIARHDLAWPDATIGQRKAAQPVRPGFTEP